MLVFLGDINLTDWIFNVGFGVGTKVSQGFNPYKHLKRNMNELWVGNFEGVASSFTNNRGIYANAFRIEPHFLKGIEHLDFYGLANNHAMEHGGVAYEETITALENCGSKVFGSLNTKTVMFEHLGQKISISGISFRVEESHETPLYWHNPEYKDIKHEVDSLPKDVFKILYLHWGNEYINRPSSSQKKLAHWLIDIGFDCIIGMHPHVLQGYEDYAGKRIYYSLGNAVFDMPSEQCKIGALIRLDFVDGKPKYSEQYIKIDHECCPNIVSESEIPYQWRFNYLNDKLKEEDNSESYHQEIMKGYRIYRNANRKKLLTTAILHPYFFYSIFIDFIKRRIK